MYYNILIFILLLFSSCVKDVDFDQADHTELTPVIVGSLFFFNHSSPDFFDSNDSIFISTPEERLQDTVDSPFSSNDLKGKIESFEMFFEFNNSIEREFEFEFEFLNANNTRIEPLYKIQIDKGNGPNTPIVATIKTIHFPKESVNQLLNSKKIATSIRVEDVNNTLEGNISSKSKGTFYIKVNL